MKIEKAILAGGCFWGLEELFRHHPGVKETRVGYTGGEIKNPTYENHGRHAEGLEIVFDADVLSFQKLLEFFFQIHDPTTVNRQGNDHGASYRSAIFYVNDQQRLVAENVIHSINASGKWPAKVVTELVPFEDFWLAEDYHQKYLQKNPGGYTCHWIRPNWTL